MPELLIKNVLIAGFILFLLIMLLPKKAIISTDYNVQIAFQEFEEWILTVQFPDYDQVRREIEAFRIENESKISDKDLNGYILRLNQALDEREHGISYS